MPQIVQCIEPDSLPIQISLEVPDGELFCVYLLSTRTLAEAWLLPILVLAAALLWHLNRRRQRAIAAA